MRIEDLIANGVGRRAADGRSSATKRALLQVSRSLEALADQLAEQGDEFTIVSLFEHAGYFAYERERYARLAEVGTVIVGFAGTPEEVAAADLPPGVHHLDLDPLDPISDEWDVLVLSEAVTAGLVANDLASVIAARSLERGRLFSPTVSTDPDWVVREATRILGHATTNANASANHANASANHANASADHTSANHANASANHATTSANADLVEVALAPGRRAVDRAANRGEVVLREELEAGWWRTLTYAAQLGDVERLALTDALTGAWNRRFLERFLSRAGRRAPQLAVVLFDLDGFKAINDGYGHSTGDAALRLFVQVVRSHVRENDLLVRHGGDEWLLLLPGTPQETAVARAETILRAWGGQRLPAPAEHARLAASAGVGVFAADALDLEAVDAAMYSAKATGGDRVVALPVEPPEVD